MVVSLPSKVIAVPACTENGVHVPRGTAVLADAKGAIAIAAIDTADRNMFGDMMIK
jgi:hypothetical protein